MRRTPSLEYTANGNTTVNAASENDGYCARCTSVRHPHISWIDSAVHKPKRQHSGKHKWNKRNRSWGNPPLSSVNANNDHYQSQYPGRNVRTKRRVTASLIGNNETGCDEWQDNKPHRQYRRSNVTTNAKSDCHYDDLKHNGKMSPQCNKSVTA